MKTLVENFKRQELFDYYNSATIPFSCITTKIDITNIYKLCKVKKHYYATIGYYLTMALNRVEEFKYSYQDGKIYKYDVIHPSFVDIKEDNTIGFYMCHLQDNYDDYIKEFDETKSRFLKGEKVPFEDEMSVVWLSCQPWFNFSSLVPPIRREISIPQLIWDKFSFENDRCYINLMIMAHHGLVDGYHIGQLIKAINDVISEIEV